MSRGPRATTFRRALYDHRKIVRDVSLAVLFLFGIAAVWTRQYRATAVVALDAPAVKESTDPAAGLRYAEAAWTNARIKTIIQKFGLSTQIVRSRGLDEATLSLREDLSFERDAESDSGHVQISYSSRDSGAAIDVVNAVAQSLVSVKAAPSEPLENTSTTNIQQDLDNSRSELESMSSRKQGENPSAQLQTATAAKTDLETALQKDTDKLASLGQQRLAASAAAHRTPVPPPENPNSPANLLRRQIHEAALHVAELRQKYTDEYPAVQDAEEQLRALQIKLSQIPPPAPSRVSEQAPSTETQLAHISAQEDAVRNDQRSLEDEIEEIDNQIDALKAHLASRQKLSRVYALEQDRYDALMKAKQDTTEYQAYITKQRAPQFTVVKTADSTTAVGLIASPEYWLCAVAAALFAASLSLLVAWRLDAPAADTGFSDGHEEDLRHI